jgi:hypothetical protein
MLVCETSLVSGAIHMGGYVERLPRSWALIRLPPLAGAENHNAREQVQVFKKERAIGPFDTTIRIVEDQ